MKISGHISAILAGVAALAVGWGFSEDRVMADAEKTVSFTVRDKKTELTLSMGDILELKMEKSGGTGFTWQVAKNDKEVLEQKGEAMVEKLEDPKPGAPELFVFRFQARAKGTSELELHYRRPFDKDKPPAKTYQLTVRIVEAAKK